MPTKSFSEDTGQEKEPVQEASPDTHNQRLDDVEARLLRVEQAAHTNHDLAIGPSELQAIADAILPHVDERLAEHLRTYLGISGLPVKG